MCVTVLQEELTEKDFADHVAEVIKNKRQKARKLGTYIARWRTEILLARFDWKRIETEVAAMQRLKRQDLLDHVDSVLLDASRGRQLSVNVAGAAERGRAAASADKGASDGQAQSGAAGNSDKAAQNGFACDATAHSAPNGATDHDGTDGKTGAGSNGVRGNGASPEHQANSVAEHGSMCAADVHLNGAGHEAPGKQVMASGGTAEVLHLAPDDIPAFRLQQRLWPLTRKQWF